MNTLRAMMRRGLVLLLELAAALAAGITIVSLLFVLLLSSGPLALNWLTPYIQSALSQGEQEFNVQIDGTSLTWGGWDRLVEVQAKGVRVATAEGEVVATLPKVVIGLAAPALLRQMVAPERIDIIEPEIRLKRTPEGKFELGLAGEGLLDGRASNEALQRLLTNLITPADHTRPTGYLTQVSILGARMRLEDDFGGERFGTPDVDLIMSRDDAGVRARFAVSLNMPGEEGLLSGDMVYRLAEQVVEAKANFDNINPSDFANVVPALEPLGHFSLPISGSVRSRMAMTGVWVAGVLEQIEFDLVGDAGQISIPTLYSKPVDISQLHLRGTLEHEGKVLMIEDLFADLNGPSVRSTGVVNLADDSVGFKMNWLLRNVDLPDIPRFWPDVIDREPLGWMQESLIGGRIVETRISVEGEAPRDALDQVQISKVSADAEFHDLTARLREGMRPVEQLSGRAHLSEGRVEIDVSSVDLTFNQGWPRIDDLVARLTVEDETISGMFTDGRFSMDPAGIPATDMKGHLSVDSKQAKIKLTGAVLNELVLSEGQIDITGLGTETAELKAEFVAKGELPNMLQAINAPPFQRTQAIKLDPEKAEGQVSARMRLSSPIVRDQDMDLTKVKRAATARLINVSVIDTPFGMPVTEGDFELEYDPVEMHVRGTAEINGVPADVTWHEVFSGESEYRSRFVMQGVVETEGRARLGFDLGKSVTGPTPLHVEFTDYDRTRQGMEIDLELSDAVIDVPQLFWTKAAGIQSQAKLDISFNDNVAQTIDRFTIRAADLAASGKARLAGPRGAAEIIQAEFDSLAWGPVGRRNQIEGTLRRRDDGGWDVSLFGPSFDAEPYLDEQQESFDRPISLSTGFDKMWLDESRFLLDVQSSGTFDGEKWSLIDLTARLPLSEQPGAKLEAQLRPEDQYSRSIKVTSDEAGAALRLLSDAPVFGAIKGGDLYIEGTIDDLDPDKKVHAAMQIQGFRLVAHESIEALVGALEELNLHHQFVEGGVPFDLLQARFVRTKEVLEIEQMRARGQSFGVAAGGDVDYGASLLDIRGLLAPFAWQEEIFKRMPQWPILCERTEEGHCLIALGFTMDGTILDPQFQPMPLTGFDSDWLYSIFGIRPGQAGLPVLESAKPMPRAEQQESR
ncbi:MAG: DUF3971 domain-containing protein [Alphaproteobacteria bacterium]|nr:DUF3971 domain-containing protein [Alphaproteobacteria bacterium]